MQLIEHFFPAVQARNWLEDPFLLNKIHTALGKQGIPFLFTFITQTQIRMSVQLRSHLPLERLLTTFWVIIPAEQLEIRVQLADEWNQVSLQEVLPKVHALLKSFNSASHGLYSLHPNNPKIICFRLKIPFDTSKRHLQSHLRETFLELSQQFTRFAIAAKLLTGVEETPSRRITDTLQRLRELKEEFQFGRQQRKKSTNCYNLSNSHIKLISQALSMISLSFAKMKLYARQTKFDLSRCHKLYNSLRKIAEEATVKQNAKMDRSIVKGVSIEEIYQEEPIDQGGFSKIHRGICEFSQLLTYTDTILKDKQLPPSTYTHANQNASCIPPNSQEAIDPPSKMNEENSDPETIKRVLVRKIPVNENDSSFLNQFQLLKFIRNQKSANIADYYLSNSLNPLYDNSIFMQYYQYNLAKSYHLFTPKQLLKIARQILQGIVFLWQNKIQHRDIKELNVLMDGGNAKLIDFGSACGFINNQQGQFMAYSNKLMATKGYYYAYKDVKIPAVTTKFQRQEYNQAETFDMYSFGQILINIFGLERAQDSLLVRELIFLSQKCQEINPEDRIYPMQALCYLREITTLYLQENIVQEEVSPTSTEEEASNKQAPKKQDTQQ